MARIPEQEIERLKNEVSVQRLVEGSGLALQKSGKDWIGKCPFHEDETASLVVTAAKNLWHRARCTESEHQSSIGRFAAVVVVLAN